MLCVVLQRVTVGLPDHTHLLFIRAYIISPDGYHSYLVFGHFVVTCWERAFLLAFVHLWCSTVSLSLSHWYPGSGVVLGCIDS